MIAGTFGKSKWEQIRTAAGRLGGPIDQMGGRGYRVVWNGEKNLGEMGPVLNYAVDYEVLRARSWQLYLESEVAKMIIGRTKTWTIGPGLKLQSEPIRTLLKERGINIDKNFSKILEARWTAWAGSSWSDYSKQQNLNLLASEAFKNALVGGDFVVVLRYRKGYLSIQIVDGAHIQTPPDKMIQEVFGTVNIDGERVVSGIHLSKSNEHLGYWVRKDKPGMEFEYVPCYGKRSGMRMAYMVYGDRYRIDNHRGLPIISVVAQTIKVMERYKEATIGSAEERSKIAFSINHKSYSMGDNPLQNDMAKAFNRDIGDNVPSDSFGNDLANRIAATTGRQAFNMPLGAELAVLDSKTELYFNDFYKMNICVIASASGIPPEVLLSKYDSNYSSSRGALKDWENSLNIGRTNFGFQFYGPILEAFMDLEIMEGELQAPGYLEAWHRNDYMTLEAYRKCRWVGPSIPHIDPLKEVQAERLKLGVTGANMPLTTGEQATENINGGDFDSNMEQFAEELNESKSLGIKPDPIEAKPAKPAKP